jgi:hypothetical protein
MSGSTLSAAGTGSSVASRPEKRPLSPSSSPQPHRLRPSLSTEHPSRDLHSDIVETGLDDLKVQPTWEDFLRRTKLAATRPSESRLSAPYPRRYGDYLGTSIPSTSLSSSHFSSPHLTSPLIPDIKSQDTPTSTYVEGESGTLRLPSNRIADFTLLHQLRLGMTGILPARIMPTPRITRH